MKILYITFEDMSLHKGSVVHIRKVIEGLKKRGHFVGLISISSNPSENVDRFYNLKLIPIPTLKFKKQPYFISSILLFFYLLRFLYFYDIIYARDFHTTIIAFPPRFIFKKKLVLEINGLANEEYKLRSSFKFNQIVSTLIRKAEKIAVRLSDQIICVTPQIKTYLIKHFKCEEEKIKVVGNGVDTKMFFPIEDKTMIDQWKKKFGIKNEELIILFVGNLARWQGVDIFIEAGFELLERNNKLKFLIVGDGPIKNNLMKKVSKFKKEEHFIFTGMVNYIEIPTLINIADICVLPKMPLKSGYSPIKLYEYMACGKPVVASRVEGLEFIENEGIGRLVEPEDPVMLRKSIVDLLEHPKERMEMGQRGRQLILKQFSWDLKVMEIETILKTL